MPQQPSNGWTPVSEAAAPSGWTPVDNAQPSVWGVLTQPTDKTDAEYGTYRGAAGVAGATIKGLDDVARGTQGAIKGVYDVVRHPIDTAKGIASFPSQVAQVPAAIKDINASPDPTGAYLNVAQDTASQGAGQALTGIASEGIGSAAKAAAPYAGPVAKALVKGYAKKLIPSEVGEAVKAVQKVKRGQLAAPPAEVTQASSLSTGAKPVEDPAAALETIPVKRGALSEQMQPKPTPAPIQRGSLRQMIDEIGKGVEKGTGAGPAPDPKAPIYQRGGISQAMQEGAAPDMPEGHTPHQSSALRSSKYDPAANEFHARTTSGDTTYVYGDVSPDEAEAFSSADSKGKAFQQIKSGHPLVAKIVNGKRVAVKASQ